MNHPDNLTNTIAWFQAAVPKPTDRDFHTQLGCHFEEVGEMIEQLAALDNETAKLMTIAEGAVKALADHLKGKKNLVSVRDYVEFLDALCDQVVTAAGVGHMAELDIVSGMREVNRSNWSKFVEGKPIRNEQGKIMKGPNYSKADLRPYT